MTNLPAVEPLACHAQPPAARDAAARAVAVGTIAFLTLVDLFAAQAILPALAQRFAASAAETGVAVNASTLGMAAAALGIGLFGRAIDRRRGVSAALALLALPTALLAVADGLAAFAALRVAQGLCMSAAFALTAAYLAERLGPAEAAAALAAYVTGNVASNLVGRAAAGALAGMHGVEVTFLAFAGLNLAGSALAWVSLTRCAPTRMDAAATPVQRPGRRAALRDPALGAAFAVGFLILFAFLGVFTFSGLALAAAPFGLPAMALSAVHLVFAPSLVTTPLAGAAAARLGTRGAVWLGLGVAAAGLPLAASASLAAVLAGLALVAVGTFFAQAAATAFVGRATAARGSASGIYLASYYAGGLAGTAVLGEAFMAGGWPATLAGVGGALGAAALLAARMQPALPAVRPPS